MAYNDVISRDAANDPLELPEQVSSDVIQALPEASTVMRLSRRVTMSSRKYRQPVLSVLPDAFWVNGDTGLKQTTKVDWSNVTLTAEPLAALVVVPDEYMDDSAVPIWSQVRPLLVQAIGRVIDKAVLFGTNKPATWTSQHLYGAAVAAGNTVTAGGDLTKDVAQMGQMLAEDGYVATGFAATPGFRWRLIGLRDANGQPIYAGPLSTEQPGSLYGYPMPEAKNGAWDPAKMLLMGGDWDMSICGVRQDITFQIFDEAVISDDTGKVIFNAMQQDSKIMRVVTRVAWTYAQPTTALGTGFPFAVLRPAGAPSA